MRISSCFIAVFLSFLLFIAVGSSSNKNDDKEKNSWISHLVGKIIDWLKSHGKHSGKKCFEKRQHGGIASARNGDSPLKIFGYPHFNEKLRGAVVKAGVPLSFLYGYRQPIKFGSRDYVFAGYPDEILAFCACFEKYKVIGSSLNQTGHWIPNTGEIKIQMQNLQDYGGRSIFDIIFKYTLKRIMKYLNPVKIIKGIDCEMLGGCDAVSSIEKFKTAIESIQKWIPGSEDLIKEILEIFKKKMSLEEKAKVLIDFINDEEKRKAGIRKKWVGWDNINYKNKKIIVTLTMYSKPEHHVRATYRMGSATVTMKDIGEAIKIALDKK